MPADLEPSKFASEQVPFDNADWKYSYKGFLEMQIVHQPSFMELGMPWLV
jgi:hypothetical protein